MSTLSEPAAAVEVRPQGRTWGTWRSIVGQRAAGHWHVWVLLGLTVAGAVLRFTRLTFPALWNDEAATFGRTHGTYRQLLDMLQSDGFVPLHYELYWLIAQVHALTPATMRLVPAIAGALMVPAMYFLSGQFTTKRTSLLVAAFAATSAYLLDYSRDAKMYMHFWLLVTLHVACLLWWFRSHLRVAWLSWMAAGVAAVGLHTSGLLVLVIEPAFLLTQRRLHWRQTVLFLIGLAVVAAGPVGYYQGFNRWQEKTGGLVPEPPSTQPAGQWGASGISWIEGYHVGRTGPEIALHSLSAYLFSFEWPRPEEKLAKDSSGQPVIDPRVFAGAVLALSLVAALAALGALPWPPAWRGVRSADPGREPGWRNLLWLGLWVVVPTYGFFYLRSVDDFVSPGEWLGRVWDALASVWVWAGGDAPVRLHLMPWVWVVGSKLWVVWTALTMAAAAAVLGWARPRPVLLVLFVAAVGAALTGATAFADTSIRSAAGLSYHAAVRDQVAQWTVGGALLLGVPLAFHFSGRTAGQRAGRSLGFVAVVAVILLACFGAYWYFDAVRGEFRDALLSANPRLGDGWKALWKARWQAMWMPRYLGFIWPAVAIGLCILLMRLPHRALRWFAIVVLIGANLLNGLARIYAATEPPIDRVAADVVAALEPASSVRTYLNFVEGGPHPSHGAITNQQGRYYLAVLSGAVTTTREFRFGSTQGAFPMETFAREPYSPGMGLSVTRVKADVARRPQVDRIVVWERYWQGYRLSPERDRAWEQQLLTELGPGWRRAGELEVFPIRMYWSWQRLGWAQRRVFVKELPPTTGPATRPAR